MDRVSPCASPCSSQRTASVRAASQCQCCGARSSSGAIVWVRRRGGTLDSRVEIFGPYAFLVENEWTIAFVAVVPPMDRIDMQ